MKQALRLIDYATAVLSAGVLAWGTWSSILAAVAIPAPRRSLRRTEQRWSFVTLVPAHDEEMTIAACVKGLTEAGDAFDGSAEILVVADNCTDRTALVASTQGAEVIERFDASRRGKGYALEFGVRHLMQRPTPPDAVLVIDADTLVGPELYAGIGACFENGADVVQVHNTVLPGESEFARLREVQFMLTQWARPLGMHRLGLGTWLKGNGMAFRWPVARDALRGDSVAEDVAMTLPLALRGVPVVFEPRVEIRSVMPGDYASGRSQDSRWEHGRMSLWPVSARALIEVLHRGHVRTAAAVAELVAPPLSASVLVGAACGLWGLARRNRLLPLQLAAPASVTAYVLLGLAAARAPRSALAALRFTPRYALYKLGIYAAFLGQRGPLTWQPTARVEMKSSGDA